MASMIEKIRTLTFPEVLFEQKFAKYLNYEIPYYPISSLYYYYSNSNCPKYSPELNNVLHLLLSISVLVILIRVFLIQYAVLVEDDLFEIEEARMRHGPYQTTNTPNVFMWQINQIIHHRRYVLLMVYDSSWGMHTCSSTLLQNFKTNYPDLNKVTHRIRCDVGENPNIATELGIQQFPTLQFYANGVLWLELSAGKFSRIHYKSMNSYEKGKIQVDAKLATTTT